MAISGLVSRRTIQLGYLHNMAASAMKLFLITILIC